MKRLLTIFLSSILCVGLWAQTTPKLPMTVLGDICVADTGKMRSVGTVHIKALNNDSIGKIANYGAIQLDSIIFYSNDTIEGLLMNQRGGAGSLTTVASSKVSVYKTFENSDYWYMWAFPFDIDLETGIRNAANGAILIRGTNFQVQYYDAHERAIRGINDDENWKILPASIKTMNRATGYRIAVELSTITRHASGSYIVEFTAKAPADISILFSSAVKGMDVTYAFDDRAKQIFGEGESDGWNVIGGLSSTNFLINNTTLIYQPDPVTADAKRIVYYREANNRKWKNLWLDLPIPPDYPDDISEGTLRPYVPIFLKTTPRAILPRSSGGGFAYVPAGLTLESLGVMFRSSQSNNYNILGLVLKDAKNSKKSSTSYFSFEKNAHLAYVSGEDGVGVYDDDKINPFTWSVAYNSMNQKVVLFINGLPYNATEVPLGAKVPAAGQYVFSLRNFLKNVSVKSAVLWDKVTNAKTDLLKQDYSFQAANAFSLEDRFVLIFSEVITSLDPASGAPIYAYADNDVLTVKNLLPGDRVQILDLTGRIVATGVASENTYSVALNQKGVYIVNTHGKVLKVLNK